MTTEESIGQIIEQIIDAVRPNSITPAMVGTVLDYLLSYAIQLGASKVATPESDGQSGDVLSTDGHGGTRWITPQQGSSGGGASGSISSTQNLLKGDGSGNAVPATPGTDYLTDEDMENIAEDVSRLALEIEQLANTLDGVLLIEQSDLGSYREDELNDAILNHKVVIYHDEDTERRYLLTKYDGQSYLFTSLSNAGVYYLTLYYDHQWEIRNAGYKEFGSGSNITIDQSLGDSGNPVANRAINTAIASLTSSLAGKESTSNRVASILSTSDNAHYPSAKAVYDLFHALEVVMSLVDARVTQNQTAINALNESLAGKESTSNRVTIVNQQSDDNHYPTAKSVYTIVHAVQNALSLVAGDVANNASDIASLVMGISGKQDKLSGGGIGQVLAVLNSTGAFGWVDSFKIQQDRARTLISNIKRTYGAQNVNPQFISDKITELIMNGQYDPLFDFSGDGAVINSSDAAVFGGFSYLMAIDEINRIADTLAGYMQKMQSAIGGMVVVSKEDGTVEESGRTVDELMDVVFGYYIGQTTYRYRWQFEFDQSIYSPNADARSYIYAILKLRNVEYKIPVDIYFEDLWDIPQRFAESIAEGIQTLMGMSATVESYSPTGCSVIINSPQELPSLQSDIYVYSYNSDYLFTPPLYANDPYPWILAGDIGTMEPITVERWFYALNDVASDRYEGSEDKIYVDRITHAAYAYHDGRYHILKSEPHNVKTIEWTIPQGVEEDVWLTLDDDQLTAVEELLDASMRGQVGVIVKKSLPGWPYPVADRYDYTHRMLDGVDTPCLFHLWPYCPSGDITYDAIYLRMNNNIAEVKYTFSRLIVDE